MIALIEVDSIFISKVIILPNNRRNYLEIQRPLIFRCQYTVIKQGFSKIYLKN